MSSENSEILTTTACENYWIEKKRNQEADGNCFYDVAGITISLKSKLKNLIFKIFSS